MLSREHVNEIVDSYDTSKISIGVLGSHSALDICEGAKALGYHSVVVAKEGREKTYSKYFRSRSRSDYQADIGVVDETIVVKDWKDLASEGIVKQLRDLHTILIPHRSLEVYLKYKLLNDLPLPLFGNRPLLQAEERTGEYILEKNQDFLAKEAGIPVPRRFKSPEELDGTLAIVKSNKAVGERGFERDFPRVRTFDEYMQALDRSLSRAKTPEERVAIEKSFRSAPIQEFIDGPQVNLNFFYSIVWDDLELLGTDKREQFPLPSGDEAMHIPNSPRESLLEKVFDNAEKFMAAAKKHYPPGIIGPFSLQCIGDGKEQLDIIDISLRNPGSPDTGVTPPQHYLYGRNYSRVDFGKRIAMEIRDAIAQKRLKEILT